MSQTPNVFRLPSVDRGRSYERHGEFVHVSDLDLAAWFHLKRCTIADVYVLEGRRDTIFVFHDPDEEMDRLAIEYANSEAARFANSLRQIKKLGYAARRKLKEYPKSRPPESSPERS